MDFVLKTLFAFIMFMFAWLYMEQNYAWDTTQQTLKNANNLGLHDALLTADEEELANGRIRFDPVVARQMFEQTISLNLGLDATTLNPSPGSPLRNPVQVIEFRIFDDTNTTFPFLYNNSTYNIAKWLEGPAIFAVIQTEPALLINRLTQGADRTSRVPAIMEYNPDGA